MADQANAYVKNCITEDIKVIRELGNGTQDIIRTLTTGDLETILLSGTDIKMIVKTTNGTDIKDIPILVESDIDLNVACSRTNNNWTMKIIPNNLPPETPTTVNVSVGVEDPGAE